MFKTVKTYVQENKGSIVKKGLVALGTGVGIFAINQLIKLGTPDDEDLELYEGEAEEFEDSNDELDNQEEEA